MSDPSKTKFSTNLLAIAGLITAIGGLVTILHQTTDIFSKKESNKTEIVEKHTPQNISTDIGIPPAKQPENAFSRQQQNLNTQNNYNANTQQQVSDQVNTSYNYAVNLSGYWVDHINQGRYLFSQDSYGNLGFQEYSFVDGYWMVTAEGQGFIQANTIQINYYTIFGTAGSFTGSLASNANSMQGRAKDAATGFKVPMSLVKE